MINNIYATCVAIKGMGVLILGKSGSGKSDLALRLIENKNAVLVSDDRVNIEIKNGTLIASAPESIKGLLEVRGVGIVKQKYLESVSVHLAIKLTDNINKIERMPQESFCEIEGIKIPMMDLYPFEISAVDKIVIKLKGTLEN